MGQQSLHLGRRPLRFARQGEHAVRGQLRGDGAKAARAATWRLGACRAAAAISVVAGVGEGLSRRTPRAFATAKAARVRWLINPASSSVIAAICVTRNLPTGPAGTVGRSQNTTPASPLPALSSCTWHSTASTSAICSAT